MESIVYSDTTTQNSEITYHYNKDTSPEYYRKHLYKLEIEKKKNTEADFTPNRCDSI